MHLMNHKRFVTLSWIISWSLFFIPSSASERVSEGVIFLTGKTLEIKHSAGESSSDSTYTRTNKTRDQSNMLTKNIRNGGLFDKLSYELRAIWKFKLKTYSIFRLNGKIVSRRYFSFTSFCQLPFNKLLLFFCFQEFSFFRFFLQASFFKSFSFK